MISTPPRMVIQQSMARISSLYHASASTPLANHSDFFNTHAWLRQQSLNAVLPWPMPGTREQILEERRQLKAEYGALFDSITALLFRHDPIGINFEDSVVG